MREGRIRPAAVIYFALAAVYVAAFILYISHRAEAVATLGHANPALNAGQLDGLVTRTMVFGGGYHLLFVGLFVGLFIGLGAMVWLGRDWVRIAAPIVLAGHVLGAFLSVAPAVLPAESRYIITVQGITAVLQVVAIGLLWSGRPGRLSSLGRLKGKEAV